MTKTETKKFVDRTAKRILKHGKDRDLPDGHMRERMIEALDAVEA